MLEIAHGLQWALPLTSCSLNSSAIPQALPLPLQPVSGVSFVGGKPWVGASGCEQLSVTDLGYPSFSFWQACLSMRLGVP